MLSKLTHGLLRKETTVLVQAAPMDMPSP